jgi:hypothetical protein
MRKLGFVAVLAIACALGSATTASATSVNLRWAGGLTSFGAITGLGTDTVTLAPSAVATLTLDIRIAVDAGGLSSAFLSLEFDTDLKDELNYVSFEELTWTGATFMMTMATVTPTLSPLSAGLLVTQESTYGGQEGKLYTFDTSTTDTASTCCPVSTTVAFGRVIFTTTHNSDGEPDVFSGLFNPGVDAIFNRAGTNIGGSVTFGTATVIPEPSTLGLLGLGLSALVVAGRRRSRV